MLHVVAIPRDAALYLDGAETAAGAVAVATGAGFKHRK
jgi:hypothetical protein